MSGKWRIPSKDQSISRSVVCVLGGGGGGGGGRKGQRTSKKKHPSKACEMNTNDTNHSKFLALL